MSNPWITFLSVYRSSHPHTSLKDASKAYRGQQSVEIVTFTLHDVPLDALVIARSIKDYLPGLMTNTAALKVTKRKSLSVSEEKGGARSVVFVRRGAGSFDAKKFAKSASRVLGHIATVTDVHVKRVTKK